MSTEPHIVCHSTDLVDGGLAQKVDAVHSGKRMSAFFIRYQGRVYGYVNSCPHMGAELDWESSVFTRAGDLLMCARHGATFLPDTGECTGGPCRSSQLTSLAVSEEARNGESVVLWWPQGQTLNGV